MSSAVIWQHIFQASCELIFNLFLKRSIFNGIKLKIRGSYVNQGRSVESTALVRPDKRSAEAPGHKYFWLHVHIETGLRASVLPMHHTRIQ